MKIEEHNNYFNQANFMFQFFLKIISAVIGGTLTVIIVVILINFIFFVLDLFDYLNYRNFFFPNRALFTFIIGAYIFWKRTPIIYNIILERFRNSQIFRFFVLLSLFYTVCLSSYIELFEPGTFRNGLEFIVKPYKNASLLNDTKQFLKLLIYPIFIFAFGSYLFAKAKLKSKNSNN